MAILLLLMSSGMVYMKLKKRKVDKSEIKEGRALTPDESNAYKRQITAEEDDMAKKNKTNYELSEIDSMNGNV
jgi:hypothetical protein